MTKSQPLIQAQNLRLGYASNVLVDQVDLNLSAGSRWGIVGPNGSGKTTLLRTLLGMIRPLGGRLTRRDDLRVGYVKQRDHVNLLYPFTVRDLVAMGRVGLRGSSTSSVDVALEQTHIHDIARMPLNECSGGQRQRALIARALVSNPDILILDEPTNDMDPKGEQAVLHLLSEIQRETGVATIVVSHLLHTVLQVSDELIQLQPGRIEVVPVKDLLTGNRLEQLVGVPCRAVQGVRGIVSILWDTPADESGGQ